MSDVNKIKMDSKSQEHETPDEVFDPLNDEFAFELDACASLENHKVGRFFSKQDDMFKQKIDVTTWVNPEFKTARKFVKFLFNESVANNSTIVMLLMVKANTNWWRDYVMKAKEVRFINQKVTFKGTTQGLRFPLCIVVFGPHEGDTKFSVVDVGVMK